jgi:hypothetical protein
MRFIAVRRAVSSVLLPVYLSSCTSWQVQPISPEQVVEQEQPSQVQVTTTDQSEVVLEAPRVSGDNLLGLGDRHVSWAGSAYAVSDTGSALQIPLADISHVAIKKTDATRSVLLGLGIAAGAFVVLAAAAVALYCADTEDC